MFCLFFGISLCAQKMNDEITQVIENMKMQETSWNKGDIRGFMDYYWNNDSLKFIGSKGLTYGWQKTLDNYIKGYPNKQAMGILTFTIIESIKLSDINIYVIGKWDLQKDMSANSTPNKPIGGHFTLLWKKINGKWVIVSDHTS